MSQKKKVDRPSDPSIHPSIHPSVNKIGGGAWYPVAEVKRQHNDIPVGRLLFRIPFLKRPRPRFESSMTLTLKIRFCLILIVEGRIKTYMCNFLVNRSDSRVVVYGSESAESRVRFFLVFLLKKFPLILSKLNARSGIRTHYLEKSTLIFIREITLKFL